MKTSRYLFAILIACMVVGVGYSQPVEQPVLYPFSYFNSDSLRIVHGYIDATGEVVVEPVLEWASPFYDGLAAIELNGYWGYIDANGVVAIPAVFTGSMEGQSAPGRFGDGLASFQVRANWGYIDKDGETAIARQFTRVKRFSGGLATVVKDGGSYVINTDGNVVAGPYADIHGYVDGRAAAKSNGLWGYIDREGSWVIDPTLDYSEYDRAFFSQWPHAYSDGLVLTRRANGYTYYDTYGNAALTVQYDVASDFSEGLAVFRTGGKMETDIFQGKTYSGGTAGFIDKDGRVAIAAIWETAFGFSEGLALVKRDSSWGYIDKSGRIVIEPQFTSARSFDNGLALVEPKGYIDRSGRYVWRESDVKKALPHVNKASPTHLRFVQVDPESGEVVGGEWDEFPVVISMSGPTAFRKSVIVEWPDGDELALDNLFLIDREFDASTRSVRYSYKNFEADELLMVIEAYAEPTKLPFGSFQTIISLLNLNAEEGLSAPVVEAWMPSSLKTVAAVPTNAAAKFFESFRLSTDPPSQVTESRAQPSGTTEPLARPPATPESSFEGDGLLLLLGQHVSRDTGARELQNRHGYEGNRNGVYKGQIPGFHFEAPRGTINYIELKPSFVGAWPFGLQPDQSIKAMQKRLKRARGVHSVRIAKKTYGSNLLWKATVNGSALNGNAFFSKSDGLASLLVAIDTQAPTSKRQPEYSVRAPVLANSRSDRQDDRPGERDSRSSQTANRVAAADPVEASATARKFPLGAPVSIEPSQLFLLLGKRTDHPDVTSFKAQIGGVDFPNGSVNSAKAGVQINVEPKHVVEKISLFSGFEVEKGMGAPYNRYSGQLPLDFDFDWPPVPESVSELVGRPLIPANRADLPSFGYFAVDYDGTYGLQIGYLKAERKIHTLTLFRR